MTEQTTPLGDVFHAWTDAERETWSAWSKVEQDLSHPEATDGCGHLLDAMEASAHQLTRLQAVAVRGVCASLGAHPLLPAPANAWIERGCAPLVSVTDVQQHMISAWFGLLRQLAVTRRTTNNTGA
jgi:hypothetical protein